MRFCIALALCCSANSALAAPLTVHTTDPGPGYVEVKFERVQSWASDMGGIAHDSDTPGGIPTWKALTLGDATFWLEDLSGVIEFHVGPQDYFGKTLNERVFTMPTGGDWDTLRATDGPLRFILDGFTEETYPGTNIGSYHVNLWGLSDGVEARAVQSVLYTRRVPEPSLLGLLFAMIPAWRRRR